MNKKKNTRFIIRVLILVLLVALIIFTIYNNLRNEKTEVLKIGDQAPDFELVDMNGKTHQLSDYQGQGVFLNFWGTWCKPCEREFPLMDKQYQVYKDKGVQILAVNIAESDFVVQQYIDQRDLTFPVLIDKTKSVMESFNINPLPTTFLINSEGQIEKIITGEMTEEDIKKYMEQIQPK
ncbi:MAG: thiol-disulfide oxidoreductase ResA [Psychrobacillus psychrotolerans]